MMTPENTPIDGSVPKSPDLSSLPTPQPETTQVEVPVTTGTEVESTTLPENGTGFTENSTAEPEPTDDDLMGIELEEKQNPIPAPSSGTGGPVGLALDEDDAPHEVTAAAGESHQGDSSEEPVAVAGPNWGALKEVIIDGDNIRDVLPPFARIVNGKPEDMDLILPGTTRHNLGVIGENIGEINSDKAYEHAIFLEQTLDVSPKDEIGTRRLQREGSDWVQEWEFSRQGKKPGIVGIHDTKYNAFSSGTQELTGEKAIDRFMFGTGMGMPKNVPLVNTGIWVRISPPGANFMAAIDRKLAFARMQFGLDTNGLAGSVDDLIFREVLNEAALSLVVACNYPVNNPLDLREVVDKEDMKTLVWGMACALYTQGIKIAIPCIDVKCNHIDTLNASPNRMFFIDRSKLNDKQRNYLTRGLSTAMSLDDIKDYKAQFKVGNTASKRIGKRMFIFESPVIADYLNIGRSWLSAVNEAVDKSMESADSRMLTDTEAERRRLDMIDSITAVESICRYTHYIKEIIVYNDDTGEDTVNCGVIKDKDTIRKLLQRLATEEEMLNAVFTAIDEFLVSIGASLIGYPNIPCPACKHETAPEQMKTKLILPFDPDTGFFILAQRKIAEAGGTPLTDLSTFGHVNFSLGVQERERQELLNRQANLPISSLN